MNLRERLKYARESLGLTMKDVESKTGVGQSSLSAFENGGREPSFAHLTKLAAVYHRPEAFFFEKGEITPQRVLWRKKPEQGSEEIEGRFLELCRQYRQLEEWSGDSAEMSLPKFDPPKAGAEDIFAKEVSALLKLGDRPALTLLAILEDGKGVKVFHLPLGSGNAVSAVNSEFGHATLLNADDGPRERAFSLAHELYHLLTWERTDNSPETELAADRFATYLLLPREPFLRALFRSLQPTGRRKLGVHDVLEVCREFGVPTHAIIRGIAAYLRAGSREADLPDTGDVKSPPPARPGRFVALAERLYRRSDISLGKLAQFLGMTRSEAHKRYADTDEAVNREIDLPEACVESSDVR